MIKWVIRSVINDSSTSYPFTIKLIARLRYNAECICGSIAVRQQYPLPPPSIFKSNAYDNEKNTKSNIAN